MKILREPSVYYDFEEKYDFWTKYTVFSKMVVKEEFSKIFKWTCWPDFYLRGLTKSFINFYLRILKSYQLNDFFFISCNKIFEIMIHENSGVFVFISSSLKILWNYLTGNTMEINFLLSKICIRLPVVK